MNRVCVPHLMALANVLKQSAPKTTSWRLNQAARLPTGHLRKQPTAPSPPFLGSSTSAPSTDLHHGLPGHRYGVIIEINNSTSSSHSVSSVKGQAGSKNFQALAASLSP